MRITDHELLAKLHSLVKQERELLNEVLRHLREVEERKLFLTRGFSSIFAFCTGALGYSESEAMLRIQAMRLIRAVPEVEAKLESGELSLTVAARAQVAFRREASGAEEKREILAELAGASSREAERKLAKRFPEPAKKEVERALSEDNTRIAFTANQAQLRKFHRLKELLAHKNFEGRYDLLFEELADQVLAKLEAAPRAQKAAAPHGARKVEEPVSAAKPAESGPSKVPPNPTRYISKATRGFVRARAKHQCEYVCPETKQRCRSRHGLQFDHIQEYAKGGGSAPDNLRMLCGVHNRWRSEAFRA